MTPNNFDTFPSLFSIISPSSSFIELLFPSSSHLLPLPLISLTHSPLYSYHPPSPLNSPYLPSPFPYILIPPLLPPHLTSLPLFITHPFSPSPFHFISFPSLHPYPSLLPYPSLHILVPLTHFSSFLLSFSSLPPSQLPRTLSSPSYHLPPSFHSYHPSHTHLPSYPSPLTLIYSLILPSLPLLLSLPLFIFIHSPISPSLTFPFPPSSPLSPTHPFIISLTLPSASLLKPLSPPFPPPNPLPPHTLPSSSSSHSSSQYHLLLPPPPTTLSPPLLPHFPSIISFPLPHPFIPHHPLLSPPHPSSNPSPIPSIPLHTLSSSHSSSCTYPFPHLPSLSHPPSFSPFHPIPTHPLDFPNHPFSPPHPLISFPLLPLPLHYTPSLYPILKLLSHPLILFLYPLPSSYSLHFLSFSSYSFLLIFPPLPLLLCPFLLFLFSSLLFLLSLLSLPLSFHFTLSPHPPLPSFLLFLSPLLLISRPLLLLYPYTPHPLFLHLRSILLFFLLSSHPLIIYLSPSPFLAPLLPSSSPLPSSPSYSLLFIFILFLPSHSAPTAYVFLPLLSLHSLSNLLSIFLTFLPLPLHIHIIPSPPTHIPWSPILSSSSSLFPLISSFLLPLHLPPSSFFPLFPLHPFSSQFILPSHIPLLPPHSPPQFHSSPLFLIFPPFILSSPS